MEANPYQRAKGKRLKIEFHAHLHTLPSFLSLCLAVALAASFTATSERDDQLRTCFVTYPVPEGNLGVKKTMFLVEVCSADQKDVEGTECSHITLTHLLQWLQMCCFK